MEKASWVTAISPDLGSRMRTLIDNPPGTEGSEKIYDRWIKDSDYKEYENEKSHERRRFAVEWGKYAEALTAQHLLKQGLTVREWDWRPASGKGEIDIIAEKDGTIVFVEVKARCGMLNDPWEAITPKKIKELARGADIYLRLEPHLYNYRFDVALLRGDPASPQFEYIEDAFIPPLRSR